MLRLKTHRRDCLFVKSILIISFHCSTPFRLHTLEMQFCPLNLHKIKTFHGLSLYFHNSQQILLFLGDLSYQNSLTKTKDMWPMHVPYIFKYYYAYTKILIYQYPQQLNMS